ncbi:MAG: LLM class F420-dependent oxidoreductase [Chloroflexi bacterium]|nr:LLM class F420-dependent oxidoreductase [Chloroflexota bacterium]
MRRLRVGVQVRPQHTTYGSMRDCWRRCEDLGVDVLYTWDHFFPLSGDPNGPHFECWSLLAAMAEVTERVEFGTLVLCNGYRNPALLSNMAKTVDHISGGRLILGIGAGWAERDYAEYGYEYGTAPDRLRALGRALPIIKERWAHDVPPPLRDPIPILIGGAGEKVTLRLAAQHADAWNCVARPDGYAHKIAVLNDWCARLGRDPRAIERTVGVELADTERDDMLDAFVAAGADQLIIRFGEPWDFAAVARLVAWRDRRNQERG